MARNVYLIAHNHFDPTWRRCFDREAHYKGVTVRSYAQIEERVINDWLGLADRGYPETEGQAMVWRKYLERNPSRLDDLRRYARNGVLEMNRAGEVVQDTNLPSAEGLVRNFLVAQPLYDMIVGPDHEGLTLGWIEDAFGNSPNYPQVLRGVGAKYAFRPSYRKPVGDAWVGIDGSAIACDHCLPHIIDVGGIEKHPPCPACKGRGCAECNQTGVSFIIGFDLEAVRQAFDLAIAAEGETAIVLLGTEELLPDGRVLDLIDELNTANAGKSAIKTAGFLSMIDAHGEKLAMAVAAAGETPTADLNPAMSGCYVTRIKVKQRVKAISYKLIQAESSIASKSYRHGSPILQPESITKAWRNVAFCQFHDSITGTHIDSAYPEIMELLDAAETAADEINKPIGEHTHHGWRSFSGTEQRAVWGDLAVTFDKAGISQVLIEGRDVFGALAHGRLQRNFRIGELVVEEDFGDAWGQRIETFLSPDNTISRVALGDYNTTVDVFDRAIRWRGEYTGGDPRITKLAWTITATPSPDNTRIDFATEIDWDTHSRRIRVIVPVASKSDTATYEVPFGYIDRAYDPGKLNYGLWQGNTMDFPTLHWARRDADSGNGGVALLNKGLPCYRWTPGAFQLSLLRSPESTFCIVEAAHYEFWDIDGQRDSGKHSFEYALLPYAGKMSEAALTKAGYVYNDAIPRDLPFSVDGDVVVTAWKSAEDGDGWILRVYDATGKGTPVSVAFERLRVVTPTDLLERPSGAAITTERYTANIHKHGIHTIRIR